MSNKSLFFVSVVLPVTSLSSLNEALIKEIQKELNSVYWDYEIILCVPSIFYKAARNLLDDFMKKIPSIRYLQLAENLSFEGLSACGCENSIGDFVVVFDLLTDPVKIISEGVNVSCTGYDVVIGQSHQQKSFFYRLFRPIAKYFLRLADYNLPSDVTNFRVLSRRAVNSIFISGRSIQSFFMRIQSSGYESKILAYKTTKTRCKTFKNSINQALRLLIFNSVRPLRFVSVLGFVGSGFACLFALYSLVVQVIKENVVEGWTSTILFVSFFFLVQFVMLAFISEYLGRLVSEQHRTKDYSLIFEKNSLIMVNRDRINVLSEEDSVEKNFVQTGRNK